jgi:hypothetical protein
MAVEIGLLFTAFDVARSVAELAGILDSIEAKVDRLVHSELNAGLRALEQAGRGTSEQAHLLREARGHFNKAVALELGYRRVVALLGLAVCHHWLGDLPNCTAALEEILEINPVTTLNLVVAEGQKLIHNQIRNANPLTLLNRQREMSETMKHDMAQKGVFHAYQNFLISNAPVISWGKLAFSKRARKEYKNALVLQAVERNREASAIRRVQESVSGHLGKPVSWLKALELGM